MNKLNGSIQAMVLAAAVLAFGGVAMAQLEGATQVNGGADPGDYLANVYKDEIAGFRMAPPLGARLSRRAGLDMLQFVVDAKGWKGSLEQHTITGDMSLDAYVKAIMTEMNKTMKGTQILNTRLTQFQGKKTMVFSSSIEGEVNAGPVKTPAGAGKARGEMVSLLGQHLIIETKPSQFTTLTMWAPLRDRAAAEATFSAMMGTLELFDPQEMAKRRTTAAALGKKWLDDHKAEDLKLKLHNQPQIFRMTISGKDIGYLRFDERAWDGLNANGKDLRDGRAGVEIEVNFRSFPEDGSVVAGKNVSFWGNSRDQKGERTPHYSMWENTGKTIAMVAAAAKGAAPSRQELWVTEYGTLGQQANGRFTDEQLKQLEEERQKAIQRDPNNPPPPLPQGSIGGQYRIRVTLDGDASQRFNIMLPGEDPEHPQPKKVVGAGANVLDVLVPREAAMPLPKILEYTWTRLVDVTKPSEMSFVVFNSTRQAISVRTLIVTGKKERVTVNGKPMECWKCSDEMDPGSTTLWVDGEGRIVSMRTSDQTILMPTTEQEMTRRWAARIAQQ